ncbi:MAG: hypothetical protein M1133_09105 [Armatimonadetes bacterium]|nr:hypothetical protein [Armatimonadota bacterium]
MSQQIPEQPNIGKNLPVTIYPTQQNAEIAMRELERFERKLVHRERRLPNRGARGTCAASGGVW